MTISEEELMAFADGQLGEAETLRVAEALAANPEMARRVQQQQRLRAALRGHLDPVAEEPVPDRLTALIAAARGENENESEAATGVFDLATARERRDAKPAERRRPVPRWILPASIAASLALGLFTGSMLQPEGMVRDDGGLLVASGALARGLDSQLASAQPADGLRMLTSFRREAGDYCRVYDAGASSGIACKDGGRWRIERTALHDRQAGGTYRQAGSAQADLMATAQEMAAGEALDALQERAAAAKGWE